MNDSNSKLPIRVYSYKLYFDDGMEIGLTKGEYLTTYTFSTNRVKIKFLVSKIKFKKKTTKYMKIFFLTIYYS